MNRRKLALRFAIAWTILIVALLTVPGKSIPSSSVLEFDKLAHAGLFLILTLLWLFALSEDRISRALTIVGAIVLFSFASEWYQELLPFERTGELLDAVADTAGALLGFAIWAFRVAFAPKSATSTNSGTS